MSDNLRLFISLFNLSCVSILAYLLIRERRNYSALNKLHRSLIDDYRNEGTIFSEKRIPTDKDKSRLWRVWIYNYTMDAKLRLFVQMSLDEDKPKWVEFKMLKDSHE